MKSKKPRLHIVGARGHLGENLLKIAKNDFSVLAYSSETTRSKEITTDGSYLPIYAATLHVKKNEPVIFLSHSNNRKDAKSLKELLYKLKDQNPYIIYISSLAVYSSYVSVYAEIKGELEKIIQTFEQFSIIRLGFVHGRTFGGMSEIFSRLAKQRLLFLPNGQAKTGFITLLRACEVILQEAKCGPSYGVENHYQSFLSLKRALELFGFRGTSISIPLPSFQVIRSLAQFLRPVTPHFIQSFLSIHFLNDKDFPNNSDHYYMRCFLIADYARLFGRSDVWQLRKYIRDIERKNTLCQYLKMGNKERFIFMYRLKEMMQIERDQQKTN